MNKAMRTRRIHTLSVVGSLCLFMTTATSLLAAPENLSTDALKQLLVGNTLVGSYFTGGTRVQVVEYFAPDGKMSSRDLYGDYFSRYEVTGEGCVIVISGDKVRSPCRRLKPLGNNRFQQDHGDGTSTTAEVLTGDPERLRKR